MSRRLAALLTAVSVAACSRQSPVTPSGLAVPAEGGSELTANTVAATYDLSFYTTGLQPVVNSTLNVGQELGMRAYVADSAGVPAQRGSVTFDQCSLRGAPAPSAQCDSGSGSWKHMITVRVDASGYSPYVGFGFCSSPTTIGFRFRYTSQGSGVANGVSASKDVSWVAMQ